MQPLANRGIRVETLSWRAAAIDWLQYDAVVIRSTWDYQDNPDAFMSVLERIQAQGVPIANPVEVVQWNLTKRYLAHLGEHGIPVVPSRYGYALGPSVLSDVAAELGSRELVIKPVIGASAGDVYRVRLASSGRAEIFIKDAQRISPEQLSRVFSNREHLIQPLVESVRSEGEYSLFFFTGSYSHTILKRPGEGDFRVQEEHGGRNRPIDPSPEMVELGASAVGVAGGDNLLYARVDLVRGKTGRWEVMELELIEPSLYLDMDAASPDRLAEAIARWLERQREPGDRSGKD